MENKNWRDKSRVLLGGKPLKIYISGPYSSKDPLQIQRNVNRALDIALEVWRRGHYPYSPHVLHYFGTRPTCNLAYDDWFEWDLVYLDTCDALLHFAPSPGADKEKMKAGNLGKIIFNSIDEVPVVEDRTKVPLEEYEAYVIKQRITHRKKKGYIDQKNFNKLVGGIIGPKYFISKDDGALDSFDVFPRNPLKLVRSLFAHPTLSFEKTGMDYFKVYVFNEDACGLAERVNGLHKELFGSGGEIHEWF